MIINIIGKQSPVLTNKTEQADIILNTSDQNFLVNIGGNPISIIVLEFECL